MIQRLKLKAARVEKGFTQEEMAKRMNMPISTYAAKELGKNKFNETEIAQLSNILDKDVIYFFEN